MIQTHCFGGFVQVPLRTPLTREEFRAAYGTDPADMECAASGSTMFKAMPQSVLYTQS